MVVSLEGVWTFLLLLSIPVLYQFYFRRREMLNGLFAIRTEIPFTVALASGHV